jgi:hypothetical protein
MVNTSCGAVRKMFDNFNLVNINPYGFFALSLSYPYHLYAKNSSEKRLLLNTDWIDQGNNNKDNLG